MSIDLENEYLMLSDCSIIMKFQGQWNFHTILCIFILTWHPQGHLPHEERVSESRDNFRLLSP